MTEKGVYTEVATTLTEKPVEDEDVIERIIKHLGEMGTYQRWLLFAMLPFGITYGFIYCIQMFIVATPQEHWCRVPALQNLSMDLRRNLSIPGASLGRDWDRCRVYDANWTQVLQTLTPPSNNTATIPCEHGWEFLFNDIPYETVISERDWVCDRAGFAPFAQSLFFVGSLLGCSLFGWMGDAYGRLPAFIGANAIGFVGNIATMFTSGVWDFAICRFITGMANDACYVMVYILLMEYIGPNHRTWVTNFSVGLYTGGSLMLMPVIALWLSNWKKLVFYTSLPMLCVLAAPWVVPESVRWLSSTGKVDRAITILRKFERINKRKIPDDVLEKFVEESKKQNNANESIMAVFRSVPLRNSMIYLILVCTVGSVGIDSILRMSETIGTNFFVTFGISSASEIPALLLVALTLDRFGRRPVIAATMLLCGLFSFVCAFISRGIMQMITAVIMRFFVNMALSGLIQMGPEILPTPVRATGNSIIHVTVFMGTIVSPYVVFSGRVWKPMPLVMVGIASVLAAGVSLLLPETKGQPMPQTIADGEKLIRSNILCGKAEIEDHSEELSIPMKSKSISQT